MSGGEVGKAIYLWCELIEDETETTLDAETEYMLNYIEIIY